MPRWPRIRRNARHHPNAAEQPKGETSTERPPPERGPRVLLECLNGEAEGTEILAVLGKRYEVTALGNESRQFGVLFDYDGTLVPLAPHPSDAVFPDEAVVRLASVLDEIDHDWVRHIRWPKVQA